MTIETVDAVAKEKNVGKDEEEIAIAMMNGNADVVVKEKNVGKEVEEIVTVMIVTVIATVIAIK